MVVNNRYRDFTLFCRCLGKLQVSTEAKELASLYTMAHFVRWGEPPKPTICTDPVAVTIFTFGLTSFVDKIGGLVIGLIFSFLVISIILISLSRVTYHFEVSDQNKIYDYASETPLVKNKINNIENQIQNSIISKFAIISMKSLNLHQLPIIPGTFTNSFEILYSNTNK